MPTSAFFIKGFMPELNDTEEQKRIVKEAIKEWCDEKLLAFGRWSFITILTATLGALFYFILSANGWHHK